MKFGLPVTATLLIATAVQAEDYRVVYSPSMALEVFIDNVDSSAPRDWCNKSIHLRIVSGKSTTPDTLGSFLPRVGTLLQKQCNNLEELPWQMTSEKGLALANGTALKQHNWRPILLADAPISTSSSASPSDLSPPANPTPLPVFALPGGCHFRTSWEGNGKSLFIPDDKNLNCTSGGWLEGKSTLTLYVEGEHQSVVVHFYQGFPLHNLHPASGEINIVSANNQRLVATLAGAPDSWLLLRFNPALHVWSFDGTLLVKINHAETADPLLLKERAESIRQTWYSVVDRQIKINVLLVDYLHVDLADPSTGAWRIVN
ncbi:hypothetical protein LU604_11210 [Erwinia tracheiphila]|uniref:Type VI secretion system-associated protein n=1 Tax=Erwinia tracheiphila TaxID=65700 RepID=A0A345CRE1_9GAMM|nr:hypothetical protein [Erwinia tracheiphila]AXF76008.1 hypothetical protein AV903_08030 [Erwinia tracheiphila]UIA85332.1 hypothetical protein LU604_11210 [Erwinia tracheiphila]UIA93856.1 hypothetical protein LU632_10775 [Erwinia tracheiphila]